MDKQIGVLFERVEKALTSLIDTMAKYNPSTNQAHELVAAEAELAKGLDDLQTHQQNHARILHLRGVSQQLDKQIKDTVVMLAKARKELVSTPATEFPDGPSNTIRYHELLAYASRISKTTMPPSGALNPALNALQQTAPPDSGPESAAPTPGGTPNGMASAAPTPSANPLPMHPLDPASQETQMSSTGQKAIPEHIRSHMNPHTGMPFLPWPNEDAIRMGVLANLAYLQGEGINPEGYDPAEEEARKKREEEEAREREEKARLEQEAKDRRMREEWERQRAEREKTRAEAAERQRQGGADPAAASEPASAAPKPPGEKKQFQFMGADDDDESD